MRAFSAVFLVVMFAVHSLSLDDKHNAHIEQNLNNFNVDEYIITANISEPDVVINKHIAQNPDDIVATLKNHVQAAAEEFAALNDVDKNKYAIKLPKATPSNSSAKGKRSIDWDATAELYKQALDFLNKYDVELRYD
uniref:RxLR-like protein n=1 Tax=Caenorhabditis tropicalis TaxID=1561998 RepID=A0A1I7TF20_9PELO